MNRSRTLLVGAALGTAAAVAWWWLREPQPRPPAPAETPATETATPKTAPPEVAGILWTGCHEVRLPRDDEPLGCVFVTDPVTPSVDVWVPSRVSEPTAFLGDEPLAIHDRASVDGGWSFAVKPPPTGRLRVEGMVDGARAELLVLDLQHVPRANDDFRSRLDAALGKPKAQAALENEVRQQLAAAQSDDDRLRYTGRLSHVLYDRGSAEESAALKLEAARLARAQGQPMAECHHAWSASLLYAEHLGQRSRAMRELEPLCDYDVSIPTVAMTSGYFEGILELHLGRLPQARRSIERTVEIARRLRWPEWEQFAIGPLVTTLASQGRFAWATQLLDRAEHLPVDRMNPVSRCETLCYRLEQRGQLALREAQLLGRPLSVARTSLEHARALYLDRDQCPAHPSVDKGLAAVNTALARLDLHEGDPSGATRYLDATEADHLTPLDAIRHRLLRIELALDHGDPDQARRTLDALGAEIRRAEHDDVIEPEERWRWSLLRARLHQRDGELTRAIETLAQAQEALDQSDSSLRPGVEADRRAAMRREGGQLLVRLLLAQSQSGPAACAARISRVRSLVGVQPPTPDARASLQEARRHRDRTLEDYRWYHPSDLPIDELMRIEAGLDDLMTALPAGAEPTRCSELPAPRPGELTLLPYDDGQRWIGFAWAEDGEVVARPLDWPDPTDSPAWGQVLLSPFAEMIDRAERLRVLMPSRLHDVSMPDLLWRDAAIGEAIPVFWGLDLPRTAPRGKLRAAAAFIVSDPRRALTADYPALEARFDHWATSLRGHGLPLAFEHSPWSSADPLSVTTVLRSTEGIQLALLYGFGGTERGYYDLQYEPSGAVDPDQRSFDLDAAGLVRSDILLSAGRAPQHVILAHCSSAEVDPYGISGAIGLAQSYVQAGADWAVGTAGPVDPNTMEVVVDTLIESYPLDPRAEGIARALQTSKNLLRDRGLPHGELMRLWVP